MKKMQSRNDYLKTKQKIPHQKLKPKNNLDLSIPETRDIFNVRSMGISVLMV